jgi:hypothetical protein
MATKILPSRSGLIILENYNLLSVFIIYEMCMRYHIFILIVTILTASLYYLIQDKWTSYMPFFYTYICEVNEKTDVLFVSTTKRLFFYHYVSYAIDWNSDRKRFKSAISKTEKGKICL